MLLMFGVTINYVETGFYLFDQPRNLLGGILQVVIQCHDDFLTGFADASEESVMLTVVSHHV